MKGMLNSQYKKLVFLFICVAVAVFCFTEDGLSQQIRSQVMLTLEKLPLDKQERLKNFADDIERYLSDYDWTGEELDQLIPVTASISLQDNSANYEERYSGTFLISNNSDIQYYDKYWRFPYTAGDPIVHNENIYDPFTGFLDFYVYIVLGEEYDKYGKFLGTPYFEKAKQISDQAMFNSQFSVGWQDRGELIDTILSDYNKPFREMKDLFFLGLSYAASEDTTAQKYGLQALKIMDKILAQNPDNKKTKDFLKTHYLEFIDLFKGNPEAMGILIRIDPDRADTYRKYSKQ